MPNVEKVGNLIIYLVDEIQTRFRQKLFVTKLLKLLYIIDETAVRETGVPVTGLDYGVWEKGPVAKDVYIDLAKKDAEQLSLYVDVKDSDDKDWKLIQSINQFDDSEFSDYEMELIDRVIENDGHKDSKVLIRKLHGKNTLWSKSVKEHGLKKQFKEKPTSKILIDFSKLLEGDSHKLELFYNSKDSFKL